MNPSRGDTKAKNYQVYYKRVFVGYKNINLDEHKSIIRV
jgi:hypothetical protein